MKDEASISQQTKYTDWEDEVKEDSIDKEKLKEYQEKYPNIVNVIEDFNNDGVIDEKDKKIYDKINKKDDDDLIIKY